MSLQALQLPLAFCTGASTLNSMCKWRWGLGIKIAVPRKGSLHEVWACRGELQQR